ncbi:hypothetical protein CBW42_04915 [Butyricicoccus porcorum]|uniref:Uncharacterized protein n=1 Tax=Butyricicoccus porcorum TaxID=1945634 RepID=A0A252F583_9FIRM|nr:hypothetical protein CBW42_04915 [Butyricicoccus porcorum]
MCVQLINLIINFSALCFQLVQLFTQTVRRGVNQKLNRVVNFSIQFLGRFPKLLLLGENIQI